MKDHKAPSRAPLARGVPLHNGRPRPNSGLPQFSGKPIDRGLGPEDRGLRFVSPGLSGKKKPAKNCVGMNGNPCKAYRAKGTEYCVGHLKAVEKASG